MNNSSRKIHQTETTPAERGTFSLDSIASEQADLVNELTTSLLTGEKNNDNTPFVSSGAGKKFGTLGNAGVAKF